MPRYELDTPCVVIDLDVMERNIRTMQSYCDQHGLAFRPHIKTHKIPEIAHMQVRAGALGITCQKIGEAEEMVAAGIRDVLIYYNIIGQSKLDRLMRLARRAHISVAIDHETVLRGMGEAAEQADCRLGIYVDCDTGYHRTGVATPEAALALAKMIAYYPNLEFLGLATFPLTEASGPWFETAQTVFERAGVKIPGISGGSSAGPRIAHTVRGLTELRAGTYVFFDWSSVQTGLVTLEECAARVVTTVVNRPTDTIAIIDAGSKTLSSDFGYMKSGNGYGYIPEYPEAKIYSLSEEHGHVDFSACSSVPEIGEQVSVIPNHICGTMNMHDEVVAVRNHRIEAVWRVSARGRVR
ncbi:alanine racemase [Alicyclobacillus macrosporangiidus]|uniref:alanine racemase n=1 Tax=Alicyclobacillus macrosporangiidus TaxID=392015 RepID=UPI000AD79780|nr:alanine racemase [Alicyclobacillus macrosporangiidus]